VLEDEHALPRAQRHTSVRYWNGLAGACQNHAKVRCRIIRPFGSVNEEIRVFGDKPLEKCVQIRPRRRIGVLVKHQARAGVLDENGGRPGRDAALLDDPGNFARDLVCSFSSRVGGEGAGVCSHVFGR